MSTLYIAATAFQLITILNIRVNLNAPKGDLIIHEKSIPNSHYIKDRVVESGLFNRVFLFKDYDSRLNSVFTGKNSLSRYIKIVYQKHFSKLDINDFLYGDGTIDLSKYDEAFCFNKKFLDIIGKYDNVKINFIDEGVGSYTDSTINTSSKIYKIYLYKPELAVYYEKYKDKFITIPALDAKNVEFKNLLNGVWGYKEIIHFDDNTLIGFDDPWEKVPSYFKKTPFFIRNKLFNRFKLYKKYTESVILRECFVGTMQMLNNFYEVVYIKMHPRSSNESKKGYENEGFKVIENIFVPWELVLYNLNCNQLVLVSVYSTASLSAYVYFKNLMVNYQSVFLFKLAMEKGVVNLSADEQKFLNTVTEQSERIIVVEDNNDIMDFLC